MFCMSALCMSVTGIAKINPISDEFLMERSTITITCEAFGYPPPDIFWNKNIGGFSERISQNNGIRALTGNGNITRVSVNLTMIDASREDTGVYTCFANNSIGYDIVNTTITVQCKFVTCM